MMKISGKSIGVLIMQINKLAIFVVVVNALWIFFLIKMIIDISNA